MCHLQPLSHRHAIGDLSLLYRYSNGFCPSELSSIISPLSKLARSTRGTSSSHLKVVILHATRTERNDRTFVPNMSRACEVSRIVCVTTIKKVTCIKHEANILQIF
nr:unnamed protein product [Callosobruchus chinensis]